MNVPSFWLTSGDSRVRPELTAALETLRVSRSPSGQEGRAGTMSSRWYLRRRPRSRQCDGRCSATPISQEARLPHSTWLILRAWRRMGLG